MWISTIFPTPNPTTPINCETMRKRCINSSMMSLTSSCALTLVPMSSNWRASSILPCSQAWRNVCWWNQKKLQNEGKIIPKHTNIESIVHSPVTSLWRWKREGIMDTKYTNTTWVYKALIKYVMYIQCGSLSFCEVWNFGTVFHFNGIFRLK